MEWLVAILNLAAAVVNLITALTNSKGLRAPRKRRRPRQRK